MTFKVAHGANGPDRNGFWRFRLLARDGTQVEVNRPERDWTRVGWAVGDEVDQLPAEVTELPRASAREIYRIWHAPTWAMSL